MTSPREPATEGGGRAGRPWIIPGAFFVLGYTLMNAGKSVFEGHVLVSLAPAFIAFNCFVLAQIVYIALHRDRRGLLARVRAQPGKVLAINLTTLLSWLAVLYALASLEPVIVNGIVVGAIPLVTLALARWLRASVPILPSEKTAAFGCCISVIGLTIVSMQGLSGLGVLAPAVVITGTIAALLTAIGVATNTYVTRALTDGGFSSADIMSVRFTLLNIAAGSILLIKGGWTPYTPEVLGIILVLTVVGGRRVSRDLLAADRNSANRTDDGFSAVCDQPDLHLSRTAAGSAHRRLVAELRSDSRAHCVHGLRDAGCLRAEGKWGVELGG